MTYITISEHMALQPPYKLHDMATGEVEIVSDDREYDGPRSWAEILPNGLHVACSITWDDMWLTKPEVEHMIRLVTELEETATQGLRWHEMKIEWRDDIQHHTLMIPFYMLPDGTRNLHLRDVE